MLYNHAALEKEQFAEIIKSLELSSHSCPIMSGCKLFPFVVWDSSLRESADSFFFLPFYSTLAKLMKTTDKPV